MKTNLIISAHCDDMLFSMGSYIATHPEERFICISPMDGLPEDEKGKSKHTILNAEHKEACAVYPNIEIISGNFLDDVYSNTRELSNLTNWFTGIIREQMMRFEHLQTFSPLGLHHPDHIICRDIFIKHFRIDFFYCELPYYIRYPYLLMNLETLLCANRQLIITPNNILKETSCKKYASQTDEQVLKDIFVEERLWK